MITLANTNQAEIVRKILTELSDWFGDLHAIASYAEEAEKRPLLIAQSDNGDVSGFLCLKPQTDATSEVLVMGVRPAYHRQGLGRALVACAIEQERAKGISYLSVKTLAPAASHAGYERTRAFYLSLGFKPVEVFSTLWGPDNPCLLMIRSTAKV
ncbi:MAG: GNAT family N-acetyltransferase [Parvibaculaceae bacterium]